VALTEKIVGMHYRYPDHYEVEREKIREYAVAVQNDDAAFFTEDAAAELGYNGLTAPLTFICVFGYKAQSAFFDYANIAVQDAQIVQVRGFGAGGARHRDRRDQEHHHQPIR
jgi:hypothetical protein